MSRVHSFALSGAQIRYKAAFEETRRKKFSDTDFSSMQAKDCYQPSSLRSIMSWPEKIKILAACC